MADLITQLLTSYQSSLEFFHGSLSPGCFFRESRFSVDWGIVSWEKGIGWSAFPIYCGKSPSPHSGWDGFESISGKGFRRYVPSLSGSCRVEGNFRGMLRKLIPSAYFLAVARKCLNAWVLGIFRTGGKTGLKPVYYYVTGPCRIEWTEEDGRPLRCVRVLL